MKITNREREGRENNILVFLVMMYPLNVAALNANNLKQPRRNVRGLCNTQIQLFRDRF